MMYPSKRLQGIGPGKKESGKLSLSTSANMATPEEGQQRAVQ